MPRLIALALTLVLGLCLLRPPLAEAADGGVMVADLHGSVTRAGRPLDLLMDLAPGTVLTLGDGASATLLALADGRESIVTGPGSVTVTADGLTAADGATVEQRSTALAQVSLRPDDYQQAAVVMRGAAQEAVSGLRPDGGVVLAAPALSWTPAAPVACTATVRDAQGQVLWDGTSETGYLAPPAEAAAPRGTPLVWTLACPDAAPQKATFALADAALADRFTTGRPAADAAFAHRVAYARALAAAGLEHDAKTAFHRLAAERPDSLHLRILAGLPLQGPVPDPR